MCIYISIYIQSQLQPDLSWERKSKKKKTRLADYNLRQIIRNRGHISYAHITFLFKNLPFGGTDLQKHGYYRNLKGGKKSQ